MRIILSICLLLLFTVSCRESGGATTESQKEQPFLQLTVLPQRVLLNAKASDLTKSWIAFNSLNTGFDALYTVENAEDLALVLDDLVERQKLLEESAYPAAFDLPQVRGRQRVMKTFILKTKAAVEYRVDATEPAVELINAYNAMRTQFNVLVNNTLDTQLLSDE